MKSIRQPAAYLYKLYRKAGKRARFLSAPVLFWLLKVMRRGMRVCRIIAAKILLWPRPLRLGLLALAVVVVGISIGLYQRSQMYRLSTDELRLVRGTTVNKKFITDKNGLISYNHKTDTNSTTNKVATLAASQLDATGKAPYQARLSKKSSGTMTFSDAGGQREIKLIPQFSTGGATYRNGEVMYPVGSREKHVYTFRTNGVKEDILLSAAPGNELHYSWKLQLGSGLEVKMRPDGSVGVFSANPNLFGNVQTSDAKSQALLDKARKAGAKDYLVFVLPAPYITAANRSIDTHDATFSLKGDVLTLIAKNLNKMQYPLSVDPTVVVTTTSDFVQGNDDGMINYASPDEIQRAGISEGAVGSNTQQTSAFNSPRSGLGSVVWNGYLYIFGGATGNSSRASDVSYCPINLDGSIGSCTQQLNILVDGRQNFGYAVSNGYIYITGGFSSIGAQNDIQYCPINSDHSVTACTQQTNAFTTGRYRLTTNIYNGYLYIIGGYDGASYYNDIQYCPINANGSVGSCTQQTSAFTTPRGLHSSVVSNGYLYITGGFNGSYLNDIQYCPINANGSVGSCTQQTSAFTGIREGHTSVISQGYLYIIGGNNNGSEKVDIQYCPLNANGSVGTCTQQTNAFNTGREQHASVVYNGYIYIIGGFNGVSTWFNDIQRVPITTTPPGGTGSLGATNQQASAFTTARYGHTSVVYNGYLYIIGGEDDTLATPLNDILHCPINADGSVGTCTDQASAFTTARYYHTSVVNNGYLYIIGGYDGTNAYNDIQYCPLNANGSVGSCTQQTSAFTTARYDHTSVVYNNYLYIIGGNDNVTGVLNDIQHCPLNTNGSVGTCVQQTGAFTTAREGHTSVIWDSNLYIIGGDDGISTDLNDIQYCPLKSDGSVGTCTQQTAAFTNGRENFSSVVYKGYLYIIGGTTLGFTTFYSDIQYCPLNANGSVGTCTKQASAYTTARYGHTSVAYNNYVYIVGGSHNGSHFTDIQHLAVSSPGTNAYSSAWNKVASASMTIRENHASVVNNNYLYIIGGDDNKGTNYNDIYYCALNANGTLGTCTDQTAAFATARTDLGAVVYNGYLYIVGGIQVGGTTTFLNDIYHCPLNANGSVGTCTDQSAIFPTARKGFQVGQYNGNLIIAGGQKSGGGWLNDVVHCPLNGAGGAVGTCVDQASAFTDARSYFGAVVNGSTFYIVGGDDVTTGTQNDIQSCALNTDGSFGTCTDQTTGVFMEYQRESLSLAANNGYLYIIGGFESSYGNYLDDIEYCPIKTNGTVGSCTKQNHAFQFARYEHTTVTNNGYLYLAGGFGVNGILGDIQVFALSGPGNIGMGQVGTTTEQTVLAATGRTNPASLIYNGYLYVIGGQDVNNNSQSDNDIQYCPLNANGSVGTCTDLANAFTSGRSNLSAVVSGGYLYIIGGEDVWNVIYYNDIQYCPVNANGSVGACTQQAGAIPYRYSHQSVVNNGYIYIIGGADNTGTAQNDILRCPVNQSTHAVGTCTDQTNAFTGARTSFASMLYNGYLYIVGGTVGAPASQDDVVYCPLNADASIGSCTEQTGAYNDPNGYTTATIYNGYLYIDGTVNEDIAGGATYGSDVQSCSINDNGSVDPCTIQQGVMFSDMPGPNSTVAYNGYLYIVGQGNGLGTVNDVERFVLNAPALQGRYEKTIDIGRTVTNIASLVFNGHAPCGMDITYALAGSSGIYGAPTTITAAQPGTTYTINQAGMRYVRLSANLDDSSCGGVSTITDISVNYTTSPDAPTLIAPSPSSGGTSLTPTFTLRTTDDSGYVRYKIDICSNADCSSILGTADQTSSQTGWSGQDAQTGTAYVVSLTLSSSTIASYTYQFAPLSLGTQYWWRATAIDPSDTNQWGAYSTIQSFTTQAPPSTPTLISPSAGGVSSGILPAFTLRSSDPNSDGLQYKIDLCSTSNCSTIVRTIDQTSSQTGWSGQDATSNTAYASSSTISGSTIATYTYQAPALNAGVQYWWRAYAIDPNGSNTWSAASSIQSFTTPITVVNIEGGTRILGGTQFGGN